MPVDLATLYAPTGATQLADLPAYEARVKEPVPSGADVTLTGPAPVWLYLRLAHALRSRARKLCYDSSVTGPVEILNMTPDEVRKAERGMKKPLSKPTLTPREGTRPARIWVNTCVGGPAALRGRGFERTLKLCP